MTQENTVWVVFNDTRKDFTKAEVYGKIKDVFSSIGRAYNGPELIEHARHVLEKSKPTDYVLLVGDPALCAICTTVMAELHGGSTVLRWDRERFHYIPLELDFS
jgi:hypothetical protein